MNSLTKTTRKRRVDGVTQRYHVKPDIAPSEVSAAEILAAEEDRRAKADLRAYAEEALRHMTTQNSSDSMRSDYLGMVSGAIGETPTETRARKLRERREHRGMSPVDIEFSGTWLEVNRRSPSYTGTNFYDSMEAAVREITGIVYPTSTGHADWVYFWDLPMGRAKAEAFRDSLVRRGWTLAEIKED